MVAPLCASDGSVTIDGDPACFTVRQDDSSRNVTEKRVECNDPRASAELGNHPQVAAALDTRNGAPTTSGEALHLAIKLAVDAGEYERAIALLEVAKSTMLRPE
jgi:hypothetical protein